MTSTPWTETFSDFFYQLVVPTIIELPKALLIFIVLPTLLLLFVGLRFYRIPRRLWIKRFGKKEEVEKLQELLAISRQYSTVAEIREYILEKISPRLSSKNAVEYFESPPSGMNRSQFIEKQYCDTKKELLKMGVSKQKIQAFL
ncbi:MAG: hypothetical protein NUV83_02850 [Candidatus Wolfebacteria bacterium]|nr:hypothetical protein [Candidatus Wolfebacteria bacterium]